MTEQAKKRYLRLMKNYNALLEQAKTKDEVALISTGTAIKILRLVLDEIGELKEFVEKNL